MKNYTHSHIHFHLQRSIKNSILLLIFVASFISCDDRMDAVKELDLTPNITLQSDYSGIQGRILYDSAKLSTSNYIYYPFSIELNDPLGNINNIAMYQLEGHGELLFQDQPVSNIVPLLGHKNTYKYLPKEVGDVWVKFVATNQINKKDSAILKLTVYENLLPVAGFNATPDRTIDRYGYTLDASTSYDQDEKYGGAIARYFYNIAGKNIETSIPVIKYIFPAAGIYTIKLQVMDNDRGLSEEITKPIIVQ